MENIEKVVAAVRSRSEHSRRIYNVNVIVILLLVFMLAMLFVFGAYKGVSIEGTVDSSAMVFVLVSSGIVRIGAVAIGIYGIQIMFSLARYHMRLSQHLASTADALELTGGDPEKLGTLLKHITPVDLDFGKAPTSPTDNIGKIVEELVKKIPNQKP